MIYVILGQTASGKTKLATDLARTFNLPLINADAFQCYKHAKIGTAQPTLEELKGIENYFIDFLEPNEEIDVKYFQEQGRKIVDKLIEENKDIIISGGTNLYIRALLFNYSFPEISEKIKEKLEGKTLEELLEILKEKDNETYNIVDRNNQRRVYNACLLALSNNSRAKLIEQNSNNTVYPCTFFNIDVEKNKINDLINKRVDIMFENNLIEEVKYLFSNFPINLNIFKAIGYKEFLPYVNKIDCLTDIEIEKIKQDIKLHTRQYAKRQRTFINNQFPSLLTLSKKEIFDSISLDLEMKTRTKLLIENKNINLIESNKYLVCGLGGVGSLIPTYLSRLNGKDITLVDFDKVDPTNLNRQIFYSNLDLGKLKVDVQKEKLSNFSKLLKIVPIADKVQNILNIVKDFDVIFDCIDDIQAKSELIYFAYKHNKKLIVSGAMGKRIDSTSIKYSKISKSINDPLLSKCFDYIKNKYNFDIKNEKNISNIYFIYSTSPTIKSESRTISSICTTPNSAGLAMISCFIDKFIINK